MPDHRWSRIGQRGAVTGWRCGRCQLEQPNTPAGRAYALHPRYCDGITPARQAAIDAAEDLADLEYAEFNRILSDGADYGTAIRAVSSASLGILLTRQARRQRPDREVHNLIFAASALGVHL